MYGSAHVLPSYAVDRRDDHREILFPVHLLRLLPLVAAIHATVQKPQHEFHRGGHVRDLIPVWVKDLDRHFGAILICQLWVIQCGADVQNFAKVASDTKTPAADTCCLRQAGIHDLRFFLR